MRRRSTITQKRSEAIYAAFFQPSAPHWSLGDVAPLIAMLISDEPAERKAAKAVAMDMVDWGERFRQGCN